jgi:hypothetical protein
MFAGPPTVPGADGHDAAESRAIVLSAGPPGRFVQPVAVTRSLSSTDSVAVMPGLSRLWLLVTVAVAGPVLG